MNKKSRIKTTLDSLFTGRRINPEEDKAEEIKTATIKPASLEKVKRTVQPVKKEAESKKVEKEQEEKMKTEAAKPVQNQLVDNQPPDISEPLSLAVQPVGAAERQSTPQLEPAEQQTPILPVEKGKVDVKQEQIIETVIELAKNGKMADEEHLVIFSLGKELYGVTIHSVESIIKIQAITEVPRTASYVLGVTNLRGTVVPVLDLRKRFSLQFAETTPNTRIIIINADGSKVGIVVDEVTEVLKVAQLSIQPPPPMATTIESAFISGIAKINGRLVILLDLVKVLASSSRQYKR